MGCVKGFMQIMSTILYKTDMSISIRTRVIKVLTTESTQVNIYTFNFTQR